MHPHIDIVLLLMFWTRLLQTSKTNKLCLVTTMHICLVYLYFSYLSAILQMTSWSEWPFGVSCICISMLAMALIKLFTYFSYCLAKQAQKASHSKAPIVASLSNKVVEEWMQALKLFSSSNNHRCWQDIAPYRWWHVTTQSNSHFLSSDV